MNLSILHISDLHRDLNNPIRNDALLNSLENDRRHFSEEGETRVRIPDLIVVSGDIIQGIRHDTPNPEKHLSEQYEEALEFLGQLAVLFVKGDRERVIIVPGNHDVSAYHSRQCLEHIDVHPDQNIDLIRKLLLTESPLRWSWSELKLYKIVNETTYLHRMAAFAKFYSSFYDGRRTFDLDPAKQVDVFDYPEFDLTVVGFSSCYNNDLLNRQGAIHPSCIADVGKILSKSSSTNRLLMAVWHHNTEGPPSHSDYLDPDLIQNLIDRGFSLGLHGHQHRPQFLDTKFRHGIDRKITVISAGTLCGGASLGHGRAYNIVELNCTERVGRLHVREMRNDNLTLPIWGRRALWSSAHPYIKFEFEPPLTPFVPQNSVTTALVTADELHLEGNFESAAEMLITVVQSDALARPLLLDCLVKLKDMKRLLSIFDPPLSISEAIHVMDALWDQKELNRLSELLSLPLISESADPSVIEIREKYRRRLK